MRKLMVLLLAVGFIGGCNGNPNTKDAAMVAPNSGHNKESGIVAPKNGHKVVVIVVDSLTDQLVKKAIRNEKFTALRYLVDHGQYVNHVVASFPSMTVSALSTVITGASPEAHRIPGLVWFDTENQSIVNYGNNVKQTAILGPKKVVNSALFNLNQVHLSKSVTTIFEDLQDAGYTTAAVNMLVYRGRTPHELTLPAYVKPFTGQNKFTVYGPDKLVFGDMTSSMAGSDKRGIFNKYGLNDDFACDTVVSLVRQGQLPDFTMVYLPSNDTVLHKHGVNAMKGIETVDENMQKILSSYGNWDETLKRITLVVMGDGGVTQVLSSNKASSIVIKDVLQNRKIYRWGGRVRKDDDIAIAPNSRMEYVYLLQPNSRPEEFVKQLKREKRLDTIAWVEGDEVRVTKPESLRSLAFRKQGGYTDAYGQRWRLMGDLSLLDITVGPNKHITYGSYPDVLNQLSSAAHCQNGTYIIVTAKKGYQFADEGAPKHAGGAQQASLLAEDVYAPLIINGARYELKEPARVVDLKNYFTSLVVNR